jgi:hypothetical protein
MLSPLYVFPFFSYKIHPTITLSGDYYAVITVIIPIKRYFYEPRILLDDVRVGHIRHRRFSNGKHTRINCKTLFKYFLMGWFNHIAVCCRDCFIGLD